MTQLGTLLQKKRLDLLALAVILAILCTLPGCSRRSSAVSAATATQKSFGTPQQAGQALRAASQSHDEAALTAILGSRSKAILSSGDPVEDQEALDTFVSQYDRMNRWVTMTDGSQVLYIGSTNYPFPIPLTQTSSAAWQFDTKAGEDEILARRIGGNELLAIDACYALADAEKHYFKGAHQYTEKLISTSGKQDGLYWPAAGKQAVSPLGSIREFDQDSMDAAYAGKPAVFDGYVFRILATSASGFTVIASPVSYGDSGIMTFLLGKDGMVHQKDLGPDTSKEAASMDSYNPNQGWTPAE